MKKIEIEQFFGMPFDRIIKELHLKQKISLNALSKQCGISRQTITNIAKSSGIQVRTIKEATKLTKNKGKNHWNYGRKDQKQSERMRINNPIKKAWVASKLTKTRAEYYRKNQWPQEIAFGKIIKKLGIVALEQHPIGIYTIDFYIENMRVAIEIDSSDKWCSKKRAHALKRDSALNDLGIKTIRINKRFIHDTDIIINVLKANNIIS